MNLLPEKIGGTKKQYMWLGGLVVVLIGVYFMNREPSGPTTTVARPSRRVRERRCMARHSVAQRPEGAGKRPRFR